VYKIFVWKALGKSKLKDWERGGMMTVRIILMRQIARRW